MTGATKKLSSDMVTFTYRTNVDSWRLFTGIASLKGETPTDIFRAREKAYIEENRGDAMKVLNEDAAPEELTGIAATRAAIAEIRAGGGKTFDSVDDLMADLHNDDED